MEDTRQALLKARLLDMLDQTEELLQKKQFAMAMHYTIGYEIHSFFFLLLSPDHLIHIQSYPGLSDDKEAYVVARLMDSKKWLQIRIDQNEAVEIGNEHQAVVLYNNQPVTTSLMVKNYDPNYLAAHLKEILTGKLWSSF